MGIFQRVFSMTKAAANEVLDKIENPVMMLNQYLRELDEEIAATERNAASQRAQERLLATKLKEQQAQAGHYEEKAIQAAAQDRETEARAALEAKILYLEQGEETIRLQQLARQAAEELSQRVEHLKEERVRLHSKRTELAARVRTASDTPGFASSPLSGAVSQASRGFDRIEQKVMEWEAHRELAKSSGGHSTTASYSQSAVAQEERNERVEEELQRLLSQKSGS
ncbi:PspA/IM30 family protein [Paenibacillus sp. CAU 1782]